MRHLYNIYSYAIMLCYSKLLTFCIWLIEIVNVKHLSLLMKLYNDHELMTILNWQLQSSSSNRESLCLIMSTYFLFNLLAPFLITRLLSIHIFNTCYLYHIFNTCIKLIMTFYLVFHTL